MLGDVTVLQNQKVCSLLLSVSIALDFEGMYLKNTLSTFSKFSANS